MLSRNLLVPRQNFGPGPVSQGPPLSPFGPGPVDPPPDPTSSGSSSITLPLGPSGSSSATGSLSVSSVPPIPTGSPPNPPFWTINNITSATTCEPLDIQWFVSSTNAIDLSHTTVKLFITNIGLKNDNNVNLTISTGRPILAQNYTWPSVAVPPGNYAIQGISDNGARTLINSTTFSVQTGSNTSCFSSSPSPSSSGTHAGQNGPTSTPRKHTNTAAIVGGTLGGLAFLVAIVAAISLFVLRQKSTPSRHRGRGRGRGFRKGWGGLDSVDYKAKNAPPIIASGASDDSLRPQLKHSASVDSEKGGHDIIEAVVVPEYTGGGGRGGFWHSHGHATVGSAKPSTPSSPTSMELSRLSSRQHAHDSPRSSSDFNDPFMTPPVSSSGRRASRTARKPVPAYEPTQEELDALAMARSRSDHSRSRPGSSQQPSPTLGKAPLSLFAPHQQPDAASIASVSEHGAQLLHGLKSKSSGHFDNQPVHYLIPDMPPAPPAD